MASRLSPEKGIGDAIAAADAVGAPLKIVGDGPDAERLRARAAAARVDVELLGRVEPARVRELLAGAAAVLMPSRYHEFSPYSALEAMAQGVPVVATAMGGLPDLLGPGRCVPMGDMDAFAARLAALWADPRTRQMEGTELLERARARHSEGAVHGRAAGPVRAPLAAAQRVRRAVTAPVARPRSASRRGRAAAARPRPPAPPAAAAARPA